MSGRAGKELSSEGSWDGVIADGIQACAAVFFSSELCCLPEFEVSSRGVGGAVGERCNKLEVRWQCK